MHTSIIWLYGLQKYQSAHFQPSLTVMGIILVTLKDGSRIHELRALESSAKFRHINFLRKISTVRIDHKTRIRLCSEPLRMMAQIHRLPALKSSAKFLILFCGRFQRLQAVENGKSDSEADNIEWRLGSMSSGRWKVPQNFAIQIFCGRFQRSGGRSDPLFQMILFL